MGIQMQLDEFAPNGRNGLAGVGYSRKLEYPLLYERLDHVSPLDQRAILTLAGHVVPACVCLGIN